MKPTFLTDPIHWLIAIALAALLVLQGWLILRNRSLSADRRWLRLGLNGLLWVVVAGYVLQPTWTRMKPTTHALLVGDGVPGTFVQHVQDSLHIRDRFTARTFKADYDSVTLVGQAFPTQTLTRLSRTAIRWIPYEQPNQLQAIRWKGIVREGELQRVKGHIRSSESQLLALRYGNRTLDSLRLRAGNNSFSLDFPVFARGQTQAELVLNRSGAVTVLDTIRFFGRALQPLTVQFVLNSPDFESRTLADWLGKRSHTVSLSATLSKNMSSRVRINQGKPTPGKLPDLIITEPANAANATVRKAVTDGRAVLFINLTNPEADARAINRALGSRWQVRRTSNQPVVSLGGDQNALPYRFADAPNQFPVAGYPIAVQRATGRVGVSLLSETYPLALQGDSLAYNRIWTATLARLYATDKNNVWVEAPVYAGLQEVVSVNNPTTPATRLLVGRDTVQLIRSSINPQSSEGVFTPTRSGWQPLADSLAIYVQPVKPDDPVANRAVLGRYVLAHSQYAPVAEPRARQIEESLPGWGWLLLFIVVLSAVWVEPKL